MAVIGLWMLSDEDAGPIESLPPTMIEQSVAWICLVAHPVLWAASIFHAHRFNDGLKAALPFVLNLMPVAAMLWFNCLDGAGEPDRSFWPVWYFGALTATLLVGLAAVFASSRSH
jgi:hypothetical protein